MGVKNLETGERNHGSLRTIRQVLPQVSLINWNVCMFSSFRKSCGSHPYLYILDTHG